jgi:TPR repeat protein
MLSRISEISLSISLCFSLLFQLAACSEIPGDAAFRAGHYQAAADLYKKAAEEGNGLAALKLGLLVGYYVSPETYGQAAEWYRTACDRGVLEGCHNLGVLYEYGNRGVVKDLKEAFRYYLLAAERGYMQSQYNLASMYSNDYIQPRNDVEGYKWFLLAQKAAEKCRSRSVCKWVLDDSPHHGRTLQERLTVEDIRRARNLADQWRPKI